MQTDLLCPIYLAIFRDLVLNADLFFPNAFQHKLERALFVSLCKYSKGAREKKLTVTTETHKIFLFLGIFPVCSNWGVNYGSAHVLWL